jgi:hypothetical protein
LLSATPSANELINAIASEMASGVDAAVECWMAQIEGIFTDPRLTTLGRLHGVAEILDRHKHLTGKTELRRRIA